MCFVPLAKWSGIDLNNGGFGESVGADEFVIGRMVGDNDDADFASNSLRTPGKIARFKSKCTVFGIATPGADKMDTLIPDPSVCWLAAFLEGSRRELGQGRLIQQYNPLQVQPFVAIVSPFCARGRPLVTGVSRNTHTVLFCRKWIL